MSELYVMIDLKHHADWNDDDFHMIGTEKECRSVFDQEYGYRPGDFDDEDIRWHGVTTEADALAKVNKGIWDNYIKCGSIRFTPVEELGLRMTNGQFESAMDAMIYLQHVAAMINE